MEILKRIEIDKPAEEVWKVLAHDFDQSYVWMRGVYHSYKQEAETQFVEAPVSGRVCEFSKKSNGFSADERITAYSEENKTFTIEVVPQNTPMIFPVLKNNVHISVESSETNASTVIWRCDVELKSLGYVLYPMVKMALSKAFGEILEDLKYFVENNEPHPEKLEQV